ncbi:MAG: protein arginine kinase [Candidatus Omnitrophica bacterium]|nr:protein arginine kinase [Candidatus Omnitrophota bacterium]
MKINDLITQTGEWLKGDGPNADIVISSRVRLARNIKGFPFYHWAGKKEKEEILSIVKNAISKSKYMKGSLFVKIAAIDEIDRQFLVERHLMSREHAVNDEFKALSVDDREVMSVMINEEDHIRAQAIQSSFNLMDTWRVLSELDNELEDKMDFAYSDRWGYLTACPTNIGTGLRASVMLHLPALVITNHISRVLQAISKLGVMARGLFGEGTEASGNFFQISNQVTLGHTEEDIIDNMEKLVNQVVGREKSAREYLLTQNKPALFDKIWRAFGTLKSARIITSDETIRLLSLIRLGVDLEVIKDIDRRTMNELFIYMQPAHLQKLEGKKLSSMERDMRRADLIRSKLKV